jgi:hypothetical protein
MGKSHKTAAGKSEGKISSGRTWCGSENDIKWILNKNMEWLHLAQGRFQWRVLVKAVIKLQFHKKLYWFRDYYILKKGSTSRNYFNLRDR